MKIAFVNDGFLIWRGGDHPINELALRLSNRHEVHVIAPDINYPGAKFKLIKINAMRLVTKTWRDYLFFYNLIKFRKEIKKIVQREKYDVINVHHSGLALAFIGIKNVVFTWQGSPPETLSEINIVRIIGRKLINKLNVLLLNFFKKTIVISKFLADELSSYIPEQKIVIIGGGVEKGFKFSDIDKGYILCQGRHEHHKRIDEVIRLSTELNFPVKIIGAGSITQELKYLTRQLKAPVEFYSNISEKQKIKLFKESSFFVSASRWEGFGLPFLEAQASGKPVIGYNLGSIPEIIVPNLPRQLQDDRVA